MVSYSFFYITCMLLIREENRQKMNVQIYIDPIFGSSFCETLKNREFI